MNARSLMTGPWWADPVGGRSEMCLVCGDELAPGERSALKGSPGQLCDDCARAREFDQTLWEQDLEDPDAGLW